MRNEVILVNENDEVTGSAPKLEAHQKGLMHRAFSVLITNSEGEILLQQRAVGKYHSAGLWTNTCCSHPQPGEDIAFSASSRLFEELQITCPLTFVDKFHYIAELDNDLVENEIDYVFTGVYDGLVQPDIEEVSDYRWIEPAELFSQLREAPENFTYWLPGVLKVVYKDQDL